MPIKRRQDLYFRKFPLNEYKGQPAVDIMKRVNLSSNVKKYLSVFYTHTMEQNENVDELAFNYYDSVNLDWMIYLANDIVDPHFDTPLSDLDFDEYISKKYGSYRNAERKIIHYENNYDADDTILSSAAYEALAPSYNAVATEDPDSIGNPKKYWKPIINMIGVIGYERAEEPTLYNTNKIMSFSFDTEMATAFKVGDLVARSGDTYAEIVYANTTVCNIKNVIGDFTSNTDFTISTDAGTTATVNASSVAVDRQVIPLTEVVYNRPVSYYDYEFKLNEAKRNIFLVDKQNRKAIINQLTEVLR